MGRLACALVLLAACLSSPAAALTPEGEALIIRWEVGSQARYQRLYRGIICPGYVSGPTFGIGYDGGHQLASTIERDWADHPDVPRLARSAGVIGAERCRAYAGSVQDLRVEWDHAIAVFVRTSLVDYTARTRRAFPGFDLLPENAQAALVSLVYNRGTAMAGERRREMREIRACVKLGDVACIARQLRAMVRLWQGTDIEAGMRNRRYDEARLAEKP